VGWNLAPGASGYDLFRSVAVVHVNDLTAARLEELTGPRRASGLLIVLPSADALAAIDSASPQGRVWMELEQWLMGRALELPVYFAHDDEKLQDIRNQLNLERLGSLDRCSAVCVCVCVCVCMCV
jgi:hypothetical protein